MQGDAEFLNRCFCSHRYVLPIITLACAQNKLNRLPCWFRLTFCGIWIQRGDQHNGRSYEEKPADHASFSNVHYSRPPPSICSGRRAGKRIVTVVPTSSSPSKCSP